MVEKPSNNRRVVITGAGVITSLGSDVEQFWGNLINGVSGIKRVTHFDPAPFACQVAAEVPDFNAEKYLDPKEVKRNDRYTHFAVAASRLAYEESGLKPGSFVPEKFGILIGTGIGGMRSIEIQTKRYYEGGPRKVSPFMIPSLIANIASGVVAIEFGAKGPSYGVVSACASGAHAIGESFRKIKEGEVDIMMAGGSEAAITEIGFAGFCSMKAMSTAYNETPERSCRPFDLNRDGFVMGEGAGSLVLESLEHAQKRGAKIYAEIVGYGASCDAYHITSPDPEGKGLAICLRKALQEANIQPDKVDYINAHGTSTHYNDKCETMAIKEVFGEHARKLVISSTKSMTGHLLGAAGAIEAIVSAKTLQTGIIPPTINYETPDPECDLFYTPNKRIERVVNIAVSNNLGFGGHNATLVFKKYVQ